MLTPMASASWVPHSSPWRDNSSTMRTRHGSASALKTLARRAAESCAEARAEGVATGQP
jgi:hypothetical protein